MGYSYNRAADQGYRTLYARLFKAMSLEQAKRVLGLPLGAMPSEADVQKAFRQKAFENHPDRGGDHQKMVEINVAKDLLTPKKGPAARPIGTPPPPKPEPKGQKFSEAKAGIPQGIEWKFCSDWAWSLSPDPRFESNTNRTAAVFYGQTDTQHIFVGVQLVASYTIEDWAMTVTKYPIATDIQKLAPRALKSMFSDFDKVRSVKPPTKYYVFEGPFNEATVTRTRSVSRGGVSLKAVLIGSGATPASEVDQKYTLELSAESNRERGNEWRRQNPNKPLYTSNLVLWDFTLYVNGKGYVLTEATKNNLGENFFFGVYGNWDFRGRKNLTKLRGKFWGSGAYETIQRLSDALEGEPTSLVVAILTCLEQLEPQQKQACERILIAKLKLAMSVQEAAAVLGIDPNASPEEIAKAYKKKVFENHPDRGGDPAKMVEVNVAKEVLEGKRSPSYDRRGPADSPEWGDIRDQAYRNWTPPPPKPREVITFDEAKAKASIPTNVEWLFCTDTQRGRSNYSGDESSHYQRAWVLYGRTADNHVFVGIENDEYSGLMGANDKGHDKWFMRSYEFPLTEKATPSWLYGKVAKALTDLKWFEGRFNSKVVEIKGKIPGVLTEEMLTKALRNAHPVSIKNILVNLGEVADDDPSVANRKVTVELRVDQDYGFNDAPPKPGYHPEPPTKANTWDGKYHGYHYKVTLVVNGRDYDLNAEDTTTFFKMKVNGKRMLEAILGDYGSRGGKKVLTRMPKGKIILQGFAEHLTGLPQPARDLLTRAAEQMK